ncbi:tagaturonate epimerase family protein [Oceanobacillus sp. CAU 1775]
MNHLLPIIEELEVGKIPSSTSEVKVYRESFTKEQKVYLLMIKNSGEKSILATGEGDLFNELDGEIIGEDAKICSLTHENRLVLNRYFDYTRPQAFGNKIATIGLGDRLGRATPGHIETVKEKAIKPVLAQQSIRELTLSERTMLEMLDDVCFSVFQKGYKDGFGADGDHIKEESDIQYALSIGMSMITLDCSDYIKNEIEEASEEEIQVKFEALPEQLQQYFSQTYLNKEFELDGFTLAFDKTSLMKNVLLYNEAIHFMTRVYKEYILKANRPIDFEISIDETETVTSPLAHFFVANELKQNEAGVVSLAPRFYGEFQKAIDYMGEIDIFEVEFEKHVKIAEHFGYKLSIHSGSDKFSVYPIIAEHTKGIYHIKTAGTNWLEALRVISDKEPNLYRRIHQYVLANYETAMASYHITPNVESIEPLDNVADEHLTTYLNDDNMRQLLHITYGLLLTSRKENGEYLFRNEIFEILDKYESTYDEMLQSHIGKHLSQLGL